MRKAGLIGTLLWFTCNARRWILILKRFSLTDHRKQILGRFDTIVCSGDDLRDITECLL